VIAGSGDNGVHLPRLYTVTGRRLGFHALSRRPSSVPRRGEHDSYCPGTIVVRRAVEIEQDTCLGHLSRDPGKYHRNAVVSRRAEIRSLVSVLCVCFLFPDVWDELQLTYNLLYVTIVFQCFFTILSSNVFSYFQFDLVQMLPQIRFSKHIDHQ